MITTDIRFEALLVDIAPELSEVVEPKKENGEHLAKHTYVIEEFDGIVTFPADVVMTAIAEQEDTPEEPGKPAYLYGRIGGAHLHYLDGATPEMVQNDTVHVQIRIRTCEPLFPRDDAKRNYEVVIRITPKVEDAPATKQLWLDPSDNFHKTVVNPRTGVLIHKGADLLIQDYDAKQAEITSQIEAAAQ